MKKFVCETCVSIQKTYANRHCTYHEGFIAGLESALATLEAGCPDPEEEVKVLIEEYSGLQKESVH